VGAPATQSEEPVLTTLTASAKTTRTALAMSLAAALAAPLMATPALAAENQTTYYSTKQPYSPAAPISSYSQPPAGFKQIYTSTVNRHGSRGLSGFKYDDLALQMLLEAEKRGQLTDLGKRLIPQVKAMTKANEELTGPETGYGNLTVFGREELQGIGERNAKRNTELLNAIVGSDAKVKFMSSGEDRATESGWEFGRSLLAAKPELDSHLIDGMEDDHVKIEARTDLLKAHGDKSLDSYERYAAWEDGEIVEAKIDEAYAKPASREASQKLLLKIFTQDFVDGIDDGSLTFTAQNGKNTVEGVADAALQFYNLYIIAPAMDREAAKPAEGWIFNEFMDDEIGPTFAYLLDVEDYYQKGPANEGETVAYDNYAPLLDHMIQGVKDRAAGGEIAAEYRFSHSGAIVPLAALLKLPGSEKGVPADELMTYENSKWRGDTVDPMGANIQWDAFQNDQGVTLVRMLYNEAEIPFHAGCMPVVDGSAFYTIEELADCLPLGSTSDHSKARPDITPGADTKDGSSKDGSAENGSTGDGSLKPGAIAIAVTAVLAILAALGFGAWQLGIIGAGF